MEPVLWDWVSLILRWLHLITGIAWIGSSFYFIHLDASLRRRDGLPAGVAGESWQVHGGGFYQMQKYMVAPETLPKELIWFKYEAYFTWISGFALLCVVYYLNADVYLIDRAVMALSPPVAVAISAASLALGWLVYDYLCKSPLGAREGWLAATGLVLLIAAAFGYSHAFSGRAAYIQTGALIGTIMVANVFLIIIPNQKVVVADLIAGRQPDPALGRQAKQRSLHNNYLTLPVLFTMISGHYPMTFGHRLNWLILAGVMVAGGVVRLYFNLRHEGRGNHWLLWPAAALAMAPLVLLTLPRSQPADGGAVAFAQVQQIVAVRCAGCHASKPTFDGFDAPPAGVIFDTPAQIQKEAQRIYAQAVATEAMPIGNVTEMTEAERQALAAWHAAGAPAD
jgi:uncharacterized membrane protein